MTPAPRHGDAPPAAVVGLGNVLMGDDAFGPHVVAVLAATCDFPEGVELVDAGTPGHELSVYLEGREAVVVVDAVLAPGPPGTLRTYADDEIAALPPSLATSPHEPGLRDALLKLRFCGRAPGRLLLVGVVPGSLETGAGLSEPVLGAVPGAVAAVLETLSGLGFPARPKAVPTPPDTWWNPPRSAP